MNDPADTLPHVLSHNPRNILESDEDDDNKALNFWAIFQDINGHENGENEVKVCHGHSCYHASLYSIVLFLPLSLFSYCLLHDLII